MDNKHKRIKSRELLDFVKSLPCVACGNYGSDFDPIDPEHLSTVGAGGGDTFANVIPLHRSKHTELHQWGWTKFFKEYPRALAAVNARGWHLENVFGAIKLRRK